MARPDYAQDRGEFDTLFTIFLWTTNIVFYSFVPMILLHFFSYT